MSYRFNEPLVTIVGQLGIVWDGVEIHVRLLAPGAKLNVVSYDHFVSQRASNQRERSARRRERVNV